MSSPATQSQHTAHPTTHPGPVMREAVMHLATPNSPCVGTVVSNERCTASKKSAGFVRHVAIDVSGTPLAGKFIAGQSFGVIPPGVDVNGKPHKLRLYSIASPSNGEDGSGNVLATTVKRLIDEHNVTNKLFLGVASNYLCDLEPGDKVQVTGPNGKRFVLPADPGSHDYVFFATGTGIAPFRGMVKELLASGVRSRIALVMGSPYATDLLYHNDLKALAAAHPNFHYLTTLSREPQADGLPSMYVHDRIHHSRELLSPIFESGRALIYICGIAGMELGVFQRLQTTLAPATRDQFVEVDPEVAGSPQSWDRKMLHKQIKPTRRVFMEVY